MRYVKTYESLFKNFPTGEEFKEAWLHFFPEGAANNIIIRRTNGELYVCWTNNWSISALTSRNTSAVPLLEKYPEAEEFYDSVIREYPEIEDIYTYERLMVHEW